MPAFNEEDNIETSIRALAELDYPALDLELIVVDDGSTDRTAELARAYAASRTTGPAIRVLTKPNGGKWTALNLGIRESQHSLVLCVDADSRITTNSLRALVPYLDEATMGGVSGQVRVRERAGILSRIQAIEYAISGLIRAAQDDCINVVPGPIGLFRKSALNDVMASFGTPGLDPNHPGHVPGAFAGDSFAEDFDLTISLLSLGHRLAWDPRAIAWTRAPTTYPTFMSQRYRWLRGTIQAYLKMPWRKTVAGRRPHPWLWAWVYLVMGPELFFLPMMAILSQLGLLMALAGAVDFPWGVPVAGLTVDAALAALAIEVQGDDFRLLPSAVAFGFFGGINCVNWVPVMWDQVRGAKMRW
jgi:cellulose synthase/poly-beta-1,6-N-acetylglucosamine synthase-like glycosyltransferase